MDIRLPQSGKAAKIAGAFLKELGLTVSHQHCLELVARLNGYGDWQSMQADKRFDTPVALKALSSDTFELRERKGAEPKVNLLIEDLLVSVTRSATGVNVMAHDAKAHHAGQRAKLLSQTWIPYQNQPALTRVYAQLLGDNAWYWSMAELPPVRRSQEAFSGFKGKRRDDWDGAFEGHEDLVADLHERFEVDGFTLDWVRPNAKATGAVWVYQDNGEYQPCASLPEAIALAHSMRDSGAGGAWTVAQPNGELFALFV
jgi:hypothetical protein